MSKLIALIDELETKISNWDKQNKSVSQSSVGWHIQHTLLTTKKIISALENSKPENYRWRFNLTRSFVYTFNKIPRGKGKAPKSVQPSEILEPSALIQEIQIVKLKIYALDSLIANNYFDHPYFGNLNLKASRKFLEIHTKHHIEIINEILL